jgi:type IV pilus assembly protein PilM
MSLIASKAGSQPGGRPPAAVELSPQGVLAGSLPAPGQSPVYAFQPLQSGALVPSIGEVNMHAPEAVTAAIRSALAQVAPRTKAVTLLLPDSVVRVFMLDFDALPSKAVEAYSMLRFRLRKMIPFDVEHAGLSYQILTETKTECKVLAAVIPGPVLAEYEAAVRAAGYEPGAVLPSSLAALEVVDSMEAILAATFNGMALTTSITNGRDLLLYRTLELPEDPARRIEEVQRDIAVAAAFFEDKLQSRPRRVHYAGNLETREFASWIEDAELTVLDLAPRSATGATTALGNVSFAGITGALAGAN